MTVYHQCQRCTACCRWPGEVRLRSDEITRLTGFLGLSYYDFTERYTRLAQDRRGLVLAEKREAVQRGVAQLAARLVRDQEVGSSSLPAPILSFKDHHSCLYCDE